MSLNISKPCVVCGDLKGKCRETEDQGLLLCMTGGNPPSGYQDIGPDRSGQWTQYRRIAIDNSAQEPLSIQERDRQYRLMLAQLTLNDADRVDLERRGFTPEEIEACQFKSVTQWQHLPEGLLSTALPGVLPGGTLNTQPGYLNPVPDADGLIIAFQLRLAEPGDEGRYRWLTSKTKTNQAGARAHVEEELPLAFHNPIIKEGWAIEPEIGLCEGTGTKPFLAANRLRRRMIGAAGGNFASSPKALEAALRSKVHDSGKVIFYPDAGAVSNIQLLKTYQRTFELIEALGYRLVIGWWGQVEKPAGDIDELNQQQINQIREISVEQFWELCPERPKPRKPGRPVKPKQTEAEFTEELRFNQQVVRTLYSDEAEPWVCSAGTLHQWTGSYYRKSDDDVELKRIQQLADKTSVVSKNRTFYPYASAASVRAALEWAKIALAVPVDECSPKGLNCTNGVLTFDSNYQPKLEPHSPDLYFLHEPLVKYDPQAPVEDCERMLSCLDTKPLDVFLKTAASIFDIDRARLKVGRIRAPLCRGNGNNGKDTLREAVSLLVGRDGMTGVALEDFANADTTGRKFDLACLVHSKVNWASESKPGVNIDKSSSLKKVISGDSTTCEHKRERSFSYNPRTVCFFNVNEVPNIKASLEAIKSRFVVLSFDKTYKVDADSSKGEIEADTRFKLEPDFMIQRVLPAFLNRLVKAFQDLMADGIDYSVCDKALEEIQVHNSHLFEFALETGLTFDADSVIPISDLCAALDNYYQRTGVLMIGTDGSKVWEDPIRPGDLYVKGANQIPNRFIALYPQAKKVSLGGNRFGLKGLRFSDPTGMRPDTGQPVSDSLSEQLSRLVAERLAGADLTTVNLAALADQIAAEVAPKHPELEPEPTAQETIEQGQAPSSSCFSSQLKPGQLVTYRGEKYPDLNHGTVLTLQEKDPSSGYWYATFPDGKYSPWVPAADFEPVDFNSGEWVEVD